ncbi:Fpg/Nei family DNA glycosylase [Aldersonia sp. NBC_00410]|uniref:Fpg/Nei family DNA glycosylase n=1 Tax=Aldersonia sp. NBC_00410 TaxID=2975954 RepID=UPI002255F444|nr:DNA-formamidopyrimidine glycosylase family protein [Aldersonia sp. NBC_00410]MCX5042798.1 Fpg/Nei family DNA glycosylase [Aldersonia sp. NBC_00410]
MPEGHTLHRLARLHQQRFAGAPVRVSSPQGKFAAGALMVDGRVLVKAEAWGKHLLHHYDSGQTVHVHLGLYGAFTDSELPMGPPVGQVRMRMVGPDFGTDLRGPTACEVLGPDEVAGIEARLGPDPLRRRADPELAYRRIAASRRSVAALLMDQRVLAGVGNVYRAELLFRHRVSPTRPGVAVTPEQWLEMWTDLVALMRVGLRRGKIVTVAREHDHGEPSYAPNRPRTYVYRRAGAPCRICGTTILHSVLEGRNLFWCPVCQPD